MLVLSRIDYARLRQLKNGIYALLMLSILAVLGLGHAAHGSQRAINLPFFSFQASELGKVLLIVALAALRGRPRAAAARARHDGPRDARRARAGDVRDRPAGPRLGHGLHGDRVHAAVRGGHLLAAPRERCSRSSRCRSTFVLVAAPAVGRARAQALPGGTPDGVPAPLVQPPETGLPAAGVEDRDRLRAEDRARRERVARRA